MITLIAIIAGASALGAAAASGGPDAWNDVLDAWEKAIDKAVSDDAREDEATAVTESARETLKEIRVGQAGAFKKLFAVDRNYAAVRADYDPVVQELETLWERGDNLLLDHRFKVKEIVTEEEWAGILEIMKKRVAKVKKDVDKVVEKRQKKLDDNQEDLDKAEKKAAEKETESAAE